MTPNPDTENKTKTKHILITGSSGYLGQHLLFSLVNHKNETNYDITAAYGSLSAFSQCELPCRKINLDLSNSSSINSLIGSIPPVDVLVHLAAISNPGACEKDPSHCMSVNCPMALLEALPSTCTVIFLSTDLVYDGDPKQAPFRETDPTEPVNTYGKSKLAFESVLLERNSDSSKVFILRSSLMLGTRAPLGRCRKQSFLQFIEERLSNGQPTTFFSDEIRSVVLVDNVVQTIQYFIANDAEKEGGVYNLGGPKGVSRVDMALAVARYLNLDETLAQSVEKFGDDKAVQSSIVQSPQDVTMVIEKLHKVTGIETKGLEDIVKCCFSVKNG